MIPGKTVGGLQLTPQRNWLDRETALRLWTENVTWFSNEEGRKGRIEVGQLADLVVADRDFFACPEADIADIRAALTVVGGKVVWAAGRFVAEDEGGPPQAMPDRSPVRRFGGYGAWGDGGQPLQAAMKHNAAASGCDALCGVHGHAHARAWAWASDLPAADPKGFWGALGCACWAA